MTKTLVRLPNSRGAFDLAGARMLIDRADVVSFDIFDTLLLRKQYVPSDVFTEAGGKKGSLFRYRRILAELTARAIHRAQQDITLSQIYSLLLATPARELDAERRTLFANPAVVPLYEYAVSAGKLIVAISDMYLPQSFLQEVLASSGYSEIQRVFVSSEVGLTKAGGQLYDFAAAELKVTPERMLHIGDNIISDIDRAQARGLVALHVPSPQAVFDAEHGAFVDFLRQDRSLQRSLLLGLLRETPGVSGETDYWHDLGFRIVGPVINAFASWVRTKYLQGGHDRAYFFSGGGCLPLQIFTLRYPSLPAHYTFASGHLFLMPALKNYLESIGMISGGSKPLIVDTGWYASSQQSMELAFPELAGTAGAYFGLAEDAYQNGSVNGFFFSGNAPKRMLHLAKHGVKIIELMFSAPHPPVRAIQNSSLGGFSPVYETVSAQEQLGIDIVTKVHAGAIAFTRKLMEREASGYSIDLGPDDAADILETLILRPNERDIAHIGKPCARAAAAQLPPLTAGADTSAFLLGHKTLGPVFVAFVSQVLLQARQENIQTLYFVARDGELLLRIARILARDIDCFGAPRLEYIYLSRRVTALPATPVIDEAALRRALRISAGSGSALARFCHYYSLPLSRIQQLIPDSDSDADLAKSLSRPEVRSLIDEERSRQRELLGAYLEQSGLFASSDAALVDVGWQGSIQTSICKTFDSIHSMSRIKGFYIGLWSDDPAHPVSVSLMYRGIISDIRRQRRLVEGAAWHAAPILEALARAEHGTVEGFERDESDRVVPILAGDSPGRQAEIESENRRRHICDGIIRYAQESVATAPFSSPHHSEKRARYTLLRLCFLPTRKEIELLSKLVITEGNAPDWSTTLLTEERRSPILAPKAWLKGLHAPWRGGYVAASAGKLGALLFMSLEAALLHISPKARERIRLYLHRWTT